MIELFSLIYVLGHIRTWSCIFEMNFHVKWNRYFTVYINTILEYEKWLPSTEGVQELKDMALSKLIWRDLLWKGSWWSSLLIRAFLDCPHYLYFPSVNLVWAHIWTGQQWSPQSEQHLAAHRMEPRLCFELALVPKVIIYITSQLCLCKAFPHSWTSFVGIVLCQSMQMAFLLQRAQGMHKTVHTWLCSAACNVSCHYRKAPFIPDSKSTGATAVSLSSPLTACAFSTVLGLELIAARERTAACQPSEKPMTTHHTPLTQDQDEAGCPSWMFMLLLLFCPFVCGLMPMWLIWGR